MTEIIGLQSQIENIKNELIDLSKKLPKMDPSKDFSPLYMLLRNAEAQFADFNQRYNDELERMVSKPAIGEMKTK